MTDAERILAARRPEDVFGVLDGDDAKLRRVYRRLAATVHPDRGGDADAFVRLGELRDQAQRALARGTYGSKSASYATLTVRGREYRLEELLVRADVSNVFVASASSGGKPRGRAVVKVARRPASNAYLRNEARILRTLNSDAAAHATLRPFVPELIDSFLYREKTVNRQANALAYLDGFVSLADVAVAYPDGIDWRDAAWMLRRLLAAIGFAHANGIVHGAVLPEHVMIHPAKHGLVLVDWTAAVTGDALIPFVSRGWRGFYPPEVLDREQPGPETDVYLAMRTIVDVVGGDGETGFLPERVPSRLRAFVAGSTQEKRSRRPDDALALLRELDALLGKRTFRPFSMPANDEGRH